MGAMQYTIVVYVINLGGGTLGDHFDKNDKHRKRTA